MEPLDGIDALDAEVRDFGPGPARRLGVLVDHLVPGSKESRIVARVTSPHVLVTGHPYVDVWQAVKPAGAGHRGVAGGAAGPALEGGRLRGARRGRAGRHVAAHPVPGRQLPDVETPLINAMERLIDFVTEPRQLTPRHRVRVLVGGAGEDERGDVQGDHPSGLVAQHREDLAVLRAGATAPAVRPLRGEPAHPLAGRTVRPPGSPASASHARSSGDAHPPPAAGQRRRSRGRRARRPAATARAAPARRPARWSAPAGPARRSARSRTRWRSRPRRCATGRCTARAAT